MLATKWVQFNGKSEGRRSLKWEDDKMLMAVVVRDLVAAQSDFVAVAVAVAGKKKFQRKRDMWRMPNGRSTF